MKMVERYNCPYQLKAEVKRFLSLQCEIAACGGFRGRRKTLDEKCERCGRYLANARNRDERELAKNV